MEYKKIKGCCAPGYPKGYYGFEMDEDNQKKIIAKRTKRRAECPHKDGRGMGDRKHMGPKGYWGI